MTKKNDEVWKTRNFWDLRVLSYLVNQKTNGYIFCLLKYYLVDFSQNIANIAKTKKKQKQKTFSKILIINIF